MKKKYCYKCGTEVPYVNYKKIKTIPTCENCGALYPEKPKDEALLTIYQDEYLADRSEENFNKFFNLLKSVTINVIKHKLKVSSSYESLDEVYDKVQWSLLKLVSYYKEKPDFKITTSFVKYISKVVLYPLYNSTEKEKQKKEISLQSSIFGNSSDESDKELCDYLSSDYDGGLSKVEYELDYDIDKNNLVNESIKFIKDIALSIYDYEYESLRCCIYMLMLYKYFICGYSEDLVVKKIVSSLDYSLVKKFEESKQLYKQMLIDFSQ